MKELPSSCNQSINNGDSVHTCNMPEGEEGRGSGAVLGDEIVEGGQVLLLLQNTWWVKHEQNSG